MLVAPFVPGGDFYFSPLKMAEYLAMGLPVVASDRRELRRACGRREGIVWTAPGDESALASAMVELARDPARRERLGRAAAAGPLWTWKDVGSEVLAHAERARRQRWGWNR
jgi:glycosyltransferase involved in cell wall biosynthesis